MSTITSPRPSNPSTSLSSTPTTSRTSSPAPQPRRPNRTALRDYYNLQRPPDAHSIPPPPPHPEPEVSQTSELDASGFDADAYVKSVLANHGLEGVLKVEGGLINEIRGLDGERKALVYDNYSKLISATDTIGRMRANMDPLTPTTSTLGPAVGHIADIAGGLAAGFQEQDRRGEDGGGGGEEVREGEANKKRKERETVRWVLGAPRRLGDLLVNGERTGAEREWDEVRELLVKWEGVKGVEKVREECERIMAKS
ncbi:hypothetical protein MMC28_000963 [Mycoblastus sanguinarius]|nr:hypothetical protein [Mycoblastus sanguinarius]